MFPLFGVFEIDGVRTRIVTVKGEDVGWPKRIIPFLRGGKAEVNLKLRLICAWEKLETDQEAIALGATDVLDWTDQQ